MFQLLNATESYGNDVELRELLQRTLMNHICDSWETKFIQIIMAILKYTNLKEKEPQINRKFIKCFNFIHLTAK